MSAHTDGRLDLTEYDERVQQAWAARTYGELEALTADLPTQETPPKRHHPTGSTGMGAADALRSPPGPAPV